MVEAALLNEADKTELLTTLRELRHAQGYALNAAAILIEVATAQDHEARADVAAQFRTFADLYAKNLESILAKKWRGGERAKPLIQAARDISARFKALDARRDYADVSPAEAGHLVQFVRLEGVPAIMQLTANLSAIKKAHDKAVRAIMQERIQKLDKMFTEVEDIGRMIHLISLNASVEAARAGGESGRSFKVIADEIRVLARQASVLIDATRAGVFPSAEADLMGLDR